MDLVERQTTSVAFKCSVTWYCNFLFKNNVMFVAKNKIVVWLLVSKFSHSCDFHGKTYCCPLVVNLFVAVYQQMGVPSRKACICQNTWFDIIYQGCGVPVRGVA